MGRECFIGFTLDEASGDVDVLLSDRRRRCRGARPPHNDRTRLFRSGSVPRRGPAVHDSDIRAGGGVKQDGHVGVEVRGAHHPGFGVRPLV